MTETITSIFAFVAAIAACVGAVAAIKIYISLVFSKRRHSLNWYLEHSWVQADSHRIKLENLQDSVDFLIHKREREIYPDGRYPAPTSELIQEQFEERLRQAGWDFAANAEYPARLCRFIDGKESTSKPIAVQHGGRFTAYLQFPSVIGFNDSQFDGFFIFCEGRASVDESIRRWKEHGFDNKKRFELLDRYLINFIGLVENPAKTPDPVFPRNSWPSGTNRFENPESPSRSDL